MVAGERSDDIDPGQLGEFQSLAGVGLNERKELLRTAQVRRLAPGELLIEQGKANGFMYLVLEGSLGVFLDAVEGEPIATLGAGETVGELSLLDHSPASANVTAVEPSRLLGVDEDAFWALTNASHAFSVNLLMLLAERLRANNAAVSKNVLQRQRYEHAAMFDGLTGIHNRRWLDDTLERTVRRHRMGGGHVSLALLDIDHFKKFNDTYGHDAGDVVLTTVASALTQNLRPTDLVARFGGEEFVMILPDTSLEEAQVAAERVRAAISRLELTSSDGKPLPRVTISVGVAELADDQEVPDFLKAADEAMYRAKKSGRNRVELAAR